MSTTTKKNERPLSPHLQVYKPQMTSMLSILHRMTGIALSAGTLMVAWWLIAAASGPEAYQIAMDFASSKIGLVMLAGWTFAIYYHLCNGLRHLVWDTGRLFKIRAATRAGYLVFYGALILTALTWGYILKPEKANFADLIVSLGEYEPEAGAVQGEALTEPVQAEIIVIEE